MPDPVTRLNSALEGRYRVERELGEGGMATVYLAEDLRHHRKVAIKVLRSELAAVVGAERFLAEIRTTANLQHPNILPLFDSGEADSLLFYVMPWVEGESLRERLEREKQLPVDEAVRIAAEVAEALEHAHRHGIVHRDVKPANILLRDGRPLVADFGIALAVSTAGEGRLTDTGLSLGTPYYMSPEQASGDREVDARSDVYALSCVLYEMLTGEPPYTGTTAQAVLGRILVGEPTRPSEHRRTIPAHVDAVLMQGLEKVPADRFGSAADFARALRDPDYARTATAGATGREGPQAATSWRTAPVALGALAVGFLAGLAWVLVRGPGHRTPVERHRIVLGSGIGETPGAVGLFAALPPDGSGILYADSVGTGATSPGYWWKPTSEVDPVRVPNLDGAIAVTFSPDAEWVAYVAEDELRKQPLSGGTTVTLADSLSTGGIALAMAWLEDGTLVYEGSAFEMLRIPDDGSAAPDTVSRLGETGHPIHASGLPGGGAFLLTGCPTPACATSRVSLVDLVADTVVPLVDDVARAWATPGGRVVYVDRRGGVIAASIDREDASLGPPHPLFGGVRVTAYFTEMQLGADGTVLFGRGDPFAGSMEPVWVDRDGRREPVDPGWRPDRVLLSPALSPDGRRLVLTVGAPPESEIWVKELPAGPLTPITVGAAMRPTWSPDGRSVVYASLGLTGSGPPSAHLEMLPADGSSLSPDTILVRGSAVLRGQLTRAGGLLFEEVSDGQSDLYYLPSDTAEPVELLATPFHERSMALSPDERWLAYVSSVGGEPQVFVRPFPDTDAGQVQVSTERGTGPVWAHGGRELFYREGGWLISARVATEPTFTVESRTRIFDARAFASSSEDPWYDVAPDDERFLMFSIGGLDATGERGVVLVKNLLTEVERAFESR